MKRARKKDLAKAKGYIGILTLSGESNCGNRLQNYAMEHALADLGYCAETIRVGTKPYSFTCFKTYTGYLLRGLLPKRLRQKAIRKKRFLCFNQCITQARSRIRKSDPEDVIRGKLKKYDHLIYGSDQIWNPEFKSFSEIYLGKYADKNKNIAVSASLGLQEIPDAYINTFKEGLLRFKSIAVREEAARETIQKLDIGITPEVTIDPTMMLSAAQWMKVENAVQVPPLYHVTYILGDECSLPADYKYPNCEGIDVGPKSKYGPGEFIYLIRNAKYVVTDSFHATVFSLLFGNEVFILQRKGKYSSMISRMDSLLKNISLEYDVRDDCIHIAEKALYERKAAQKLNDEISHFRRYVSSNLASGQREQT